MVMVVSWRIALAVVLLCSVLAAAGFEEEDWGEGLRVLTTHRPDDCEHMAKKSDVIHYHYVGRLGENGDVFGKSFDYNSPYIVSLGHGRIIPGMDRGLMGTCLWERRRITIPPHLGYGERGVGKIIPGNSTLVFYIRLIKIERNGHSLGESQGIEDMWRTGMKNYEQSQWQVTVDMVEEALRLFHRYENESYLCLKKCKEEGSEFNLTKQEHDVVDKYTSEDPFVEQFLVYASRVKCVRECKAQSLPAKMQNPDPEILQLFRDRVPYSYLHFSYYQLENVEEAARCFFTFYFYNSEEESAVSNALFYRNSLGMDPDEFVSREPGVQPHQEAYRLGQKAYDREEWLASADHFEQAVTLYRDSLDHCLLLCEDVMTVNLTQKDMNPQKKAKYDEHEFVANTMEYYQLLVVIIRELLECRVDCHKRMATINAEFTEDYLSTHFHYLQYDYYKLGQILKAAEAAATYRLMNPSDEVMANNIRYYTNSFKIDAQAFVPRQEIVFLHDHLETERRLLHFAEHKEPKKKQGKRGDQAPANHQEL